MGDNWLWHKVKPFANGGVSGMMATCAIQPIDIVKVSVFACTTRLRTAFNNTIDDVLAHLFFHTQVRIQLGAQGSDVLAAADGHLLCGGDRSAICETDLLIPIRREKVHYFYRRRASLNAAIDEGLANASRMASRDV